MELLIQSASWCFLLRAARRVPGNYSIFMLFIFFLYFIFYIVFVFINQIHTRQYY